MRDSLLYTHRPRGDGYGVVIQGYDHSGQPLEFVVPPGMLHANLTQQARWVNQVWLADTIRRAGIKAGTPLEHLQPVIDAILPAQLDVELWDSPEMAADDTNELLERGDDIFGQSRDRTTLTAPVRRAVARR
jgi:hypothetical protein